MPKKSLSFFELGSCMWRAAFFSSGRYYRGVFLLYRARMRGNAAMELMTVLEAWEMIQTKTSFTKDIGQMVPSRKMRKSACCVCQCLRVPHRCQGEPLRGEEMSSTWFFT